MKWAFVFYLIVVEDVGRCPRVPWFPWSPVSLCEVVWPVGVWPRGCRSVESLLSEDEGCGCSDCSPGPLPLSPLSSPNTELMFRHDTDDGRCYSCVQPTCCVSNISCQGLNLVLFVQFILSCHSVTNICIWQSSSEQGKKACVGTKLGGLKPGSDPNSKCSELLFEFPIETWAMPQCTNTTNCRPKFRFPSTRISFAVHTLYRYVIIPNNNILRSHLNKIMKVGSR